MDMKKLTAIAAAAIMATGICTGFPNMAGTETGSPLAITAEAAKSDFVIETDDEGEKYVAEYKGKGGDVKIPDDINYVGESVFEGNADITSVTFPKKCDWVEPNAFKGCINLEKVLFEGNAGFGEEAFEYCVNLKSVTVKGGMTYRIGTQAFYACQSLETVKITKNKATGDKFYIDANAFRDCYSLTSINIPEGCTDIYRCAFLNCFSLTKLTIPADTKINLENEGVGHFGYALLYKTKPEHATYAFGDGEVEPYIFVADGKKSGYADKLIPVPTVLDSDNLDSSDFYYTTVYNLYYGGEKYTPKQLTVTVTKGSSAEKWAKENKVKYVYAGSSSDKAGAPSGFKAKKTSSSITLTWDAVDGADIYRVYKYNAETKKYEKYKDVKSAKCTIKELSANTKYKFKVASYSKNSNGKYVKDGISKAVSVTTKK